MAKAKLEGVRSSHIDISRPNKGRHTLSLDWVREMEHPTTIDGIPLTEIAKDYNNFNTDDEVERFFDEKILGKVTIPADQRQAAIQYLASTFHQGGFLQLASAPSALSMKETRTVAEYVGTGPNRHLEKVEKVMPFATANNPEKKVAITTTSTGFKVEEIATSEKIMLGGDYRTQNGIDDYFFRADPGKDYAMQTDAAVSVDFTNFEAGNTEPVIKVERNTINYGNARLQQAMENTLEYKLHEFKTELSKLEGSKKKTELDLLAEGKAIVRKIEANINTKDPKEYNASKKVLQLSIDSIKALHQERGKLKEKVSEAAAYAQEISKPSSSSFLQKLGAGLMVFAGLALIAGGILAAGLTGGVSLVASAVGAAAVKKGVELFNGARENEATPS